LGRRTTYNSGDAVDANSFLDYAEYATKTLLDVAAASWGTAEKGYVSFVNSEGKYYYWTGAANVEFPVTGGSGASIACSFVTINSESGLEAEIRHQDIPIENVHICKLHQETHGNGGTDQIDVTGLSGLLADEQDAGYVKSIPVDNTDFGVGKILAVHTDLSKLVYISIPGGGDMTKAIYDTNDDGRVGLAVDSDTVDGSHASAFALASHKNTHKYGGGDAFAGGDLLDATARVEVYKNSGGSPVGIRRGFDLVEGDGITLTVADNPAGEKVQVTITNSGTVAGEWVQVSGTNPIVYAHGKGYTPKVLAQVTNTLQTYPQPGLVVDDTNITIYHSAAGSLTYTLFISSS